LELVRIRMVKPMSGVMDTVSLSYLTPGGTYDVSPGLARYLVSCGAAEEIDSTQPGLVIPADDPYTAHLTGGITVTNANLSVAEIVEQRPITVRPFPKGEPNGS
jgi:hypothetical protein